jgi:ribonuclease J
MAKNIKLKIIALGGMGEVGKNITAFEYGKDILVVDCGIAFPDEEMLGVDQVIPDISYLQKNADKVRGIVLTHGHEDHIGGVPYFLKEIMVPIYSTRLTLGILENKLQEHGLKGKAKLNVVKEGDVVRLGVFSVEFIRVNHSIPDAMALAIRTPVGLVVHTGDFKVDFTPTQGLPIDVARFAQLGYEGVLALLSDSTNAERPGYTMTERRVGDSLDAIFAKCEGQRIIVATFASNVHRVQQIIDFAVAHGRKVVVNGRSMVNIVKAARELGYMSVPEGTLVDIEHINRYPKEKVLMVTTGSQGEPMSALHRMAFSDHRQVTIGPGDLVILSASPIPGNEKLIGKVVNELMRQGAQVIYDAAAEVHVSGHGCREELKLMLALTKPKFFLPVHGEHRHTRAHAGLAENMGIDPSRIIVPELGKVIEIDENSMRVNGTVPSGKILVDGLGVGDVGNIVLRDRRHLSQDGLIIVVAAIDSSNGMLVFGPDIVSRGFVYVRESEELMEMVKECAQKALLKCQNDKITEWNSIKAQVKASISQFLWEKTKKNPMILPVIMEV